MTLFFQTHPERTDQDLLGFNPLCLAVSDGRGSGVKN